MSFVGNSIQGFGGFTPPAAFNPRNPFRRLVAKRAYFARVYDCQNSTTNGCRRALCDLPPPNCEQMIRWSRNPTVYLTHS